MPSSHRTTSKGRGIRAAVLAAFVVSAFVANAAGPALAQPKPPVPADVAGFVLADHPSTPSYDPTVSYNTIGAPNPITRVGVGEYQVVFDGIGKPGGNAQVTSFGPTASICELSLFVPNSDGEFVAVTCYDSGGNAADAMFEASFMNRQTPLSGQLAYVWANQPLRHSYIPPLDHQFNSAGGDIRVTHIGPGKFVLLVPHVDGTAGTVKVTAFHTGSDFCRTTNWIESSTTPTARVRLKCFTSGGAPDDAQFTAAYSNQGDVLGTGLANGYAWSDHLAPAQGVVFNPALARQYDSAGGTVTEVRTGVGVYDVTFPNLASTNGIAHVTAYHLVNECQALNMAVSGADEVVTVGCFAAGTANPVNNRFTIQFVHS